ncbi:exopolyphosphatase [Crocinitomicaceae bacterium]|jgi:exopolyphosphatase/guanosine-5'-triphosphate,3'-diphosphate pyrophosphatase|nr:exopolyphosphatase [Crocinitomicaceae bacterium]
MKYGAIDIGTNAARLLIGEVVHDSGRSFVKKISYTRIPLRLGDDVFSLGRIDVKKKLNLINTMKAFEIITDIFEVNELKAYATSAMREAENAEQIVTDIKSATGINLDIISGAEEANVILGTFMLLDFDKGRPFVVIDVGGGSTEINIFKKGEQVGSKSFKVGTLRMLRDKINPEVWGEITAWISDYLLPFEEYRIFGTGGNINKAHKLLAHGPNDAATIEELTRLKNELESLNLSERMKRFQLRPDRADVIVPALDIYTNILANFKSKLIHVPKVGLSDGMVYQMYLQENNN